MCVHESEIQREREGMVNVKQFKFPEWKIPTLCLYSPERELCAVNASCAFSKHTDGNYILTDTTTTGNRVQVHDDYIQNYAAVVFYKFSVCL